jgi:hypothetical protein
MHNVMGMDIPINQGQDERIKDNNENTMAVLKRFVDLSQNLYMQTLAKVIIDK